MVTYMNYYGNGYYMGVPVYPQDDERRLIKRYYNKALIVYTILSVQFLLFRLLHPQHYIIGLGIMLGSGCDMNTAVSYVQDNEMLREFAGILYLLLIEVVTIIIGGKMLRINLTGLFKKPTKLAAPVAEGTALISLLSFAASFIFAIIAAIISVALDYELPISETDTMPSVLFLIYGCIIGPATEELLFRGLFYNALSKYSRRMAIVMSSLMFALFHGNLTQFFYTFWCGLILAYIMEKYNSIIPCILSHMALNTISLAIKQPLMYYLDSPLSTEFPDITAGMLIAVGLTIALCIAGLIVLIVRLAKRKVNFHKPTPAGKTRAYPLLLSCAMFVPSMLFFVIETVCNFG